MLFGRVVAVSWLVSCVVVILRRILCALCTPARPEDMGAACLGREDERHLVVVLPALVRVRAEEIEHRRLERTLDRSIGHEKEVQTDAP
jgi:hypothetical protein